MTTKTPTIYELIDKMNTLDDTQVTLLVSTVVKELRDRALMAKAYHPLSAVIVHNVTKNAAQRSMGLPGNGVLPTKE